ncbi:peptidase M22 [Opitutaceae bacterium EW11]|nr:peptidase M22 [Opitutaceae bacterium EW11]
MLSLRDLLSRHSPLLLIDSSSSNIQVGLLRSDAAPVWTEAIDEAGTAVFAGADRVLSQAGVRLADVRAYAFCDGPGSVLGIRTAAVALRTWRVVHALPAYAYCSLRLVAAFQLQAGEPAPFAVIADARRDTWHRVAAAENGELSPLHRTPGASVSGSLLTPQHFRSWAALPAGTRQVPYSVRDLLAALETTPLFHETSEPDAFLHEEPVYQTWTPQVHRAPS